jgi:hypothetical protein
MSAFHGFFMNAILQILSVSQYTCDVIVAPCCVNSTISTLFSAPSQKTIAINFLADNIFLNFFGLFSSFTALTELWFQYSQTKPTFHHLLLIRCDWVIQLYICDIALKKSNPEAIRFILDARVRKTCDSIA